MFRSELEIIAVDGRPGFWQVGLPLVFRYLEEDLTVPVGFVTDLASIPRILDWIPGFSRDGVSRRAAVVHDALYNIDRSRGKTFADEILFKALLSEGADRLVARSIWAGVHFGGASSWAGDSADSAGDFYTAADRTAWSGSLFSKAQL